MNTPARFLPTLFDRLSDEAPHQPVEGRTQRLYSLADYTASLVRDLETLVNTRQNMRPRSLDAFPQLRGSLLEYGLPDFTSKGLLNPQDRTQIRLQLKQAIETGDRRFRQVRVQLLDSLTQQRQLTFRVDALLRLPETTRQVSFDAVLQVNTQAYTVQNLN